jgi:hypothetical protein
VPREASDRTHRHTCITTVASSLNKWQLNLATSSQLNLPTCSHKQLKATNCRVYLPTTQPPLHIIIHYTAHTTQPTLHTIIHYTTHTTQPTLHIIIHYTTRFTTHSILLSPAPSPTVLHTLYCSHLLHHPLYYTLYTALTCSITRCTTHSILLSPAPSPTVLHTLYCSHLPHHPLYYTLYTSPHSLYIASPAPSSGVSFGILQPPFLRKAQHPHLQARARCEGEVRGRGVRARCEGEVRGRGARTRCEGERVCK